MVALQGLCARVALPPQITAFGALRGREPCSGRSQAKEQGQSRHAPLHCHRPWREAQHTATEEPEEPCKGLWSIGILIGRGIWPNVILLVHQPVVHVRLSGRGQAQVW